MSDPWAAYVDPAASAPAPAQAPAAADPWAAFAAPASAPDPYQQEAATTFAKATAAGADPSYGPTESFINGTMLGALPTVMAGLETPIEMAMHGTLNPATGYDYAKAKEDLAAQQGNAAHPILNAVADLAGGGMSGMGLAKAGVTAIPEGAGAMGRIFGSAADGAGLGAASGFLSGEGDGRLSGAAEGGLLGGAIGGVVPAAASVAKGVMAVPIAKLSAWRWPQEAAQSTLARAILNSGQSIPDLQGALDNATAAGQPNYTLADALGKSGGDALSNVVRSPGEGAVTAANFLDARQASQGRDVANQLQTGLGVSQTANQLSDALTNQRGAQADINYGMARAAPGAGAVDVSPAIQAADSVLTPGVMRFVNPNSNIADNSVEAAVRRAKSYLTDGNSQLSNFPDVFAAKREIDNMIENGTPTIQAALMPMKRALDNAMIDASPAYQYARDTFAQQSRAIDAIDTGRGAARSGRPEDTIPAYNSLEPGAQAAYRTGYADPLLEQASNGNPMANKALPLANEGTRAELGAMSQYQGPLQPGARDQLAQALDRSEGMNATYRRARTGSQSFDNLAEGHQQGIDPGILLEGLKGNFHGMALDAMRHAGNFFSGSTPAVRNHLAEMLLMHGQDADVAAAVAPKVRSIQWRNNVANALRSLAVGGGAISAGQNIAGQER